MKRLIAPMVACACLLCTLAYAETTVSSNIITDTTWTKAGSPYLITQSIDVYPGVTLSIEPGVEITFDNGTDLEIFGSLIAFGTESDMITFSSGRGIFLRDEATPSTWDEDNGYVGGSIINYCEINDGGLETHVDLCVLNSKIFGSHRPNYGYSLVNHGISLIQNNDISGIYNYISGQSTIIVNNTVSNSSKGIYNLARDVSIIDNTITQNGDTGIYNSGHDVIINNNIIKDNSEQAFFQSHSVAPTIMTVHGSSGIYNIQDDVEIDGNEITNNEFCGIYDIGRATIKNNVIEDNSVTYEHGAGIYTSGGGEIVGNIITGNPCGIVNEGLASNIISNTVSNNNRVGLSVKFGTTGTIANNTITYNGGGGIHNWSTSSTIIIDSNEIRGNTGYGIETFALLQSFTGNNIYDNTDYAFYFNGTTDQTATNNYWGTTNPSEIDAGIYDYWDDIRLGKVIYEPFATEPFVPTPDISISLSSYAFGAVNTGNASPAQTFTITNTGYADLVIGTLSVEGADASEFTTVTDYSSGQTLGPSETSTVDIAFSPTSEGVKSANLSIPSNDPDTPTVNVSLSGMGFQSFVPTPDMSISLSSYDFGTVITGNASTVQTFTITNTGDADLVIGTLSVGGANASEFTIVTDYSSGQTLGPSETSTVDIAFSPTSEGVKSANLSIPSNDPDTPTVNVSLSGMGSDVSEGCMITSDLWIRAVINTEEKGPIEAVWQKGGEDNTSRGDRVIWGHFYASPNDVTWGSSDNPDLFVKIWFDVSGRIDVNYFHVSVPDIEVYSDYPHDGTVDEQGTTTTDRRYIRQYYEGGQSHSEDNYEDGYPAAGYSQTGNPSGYSTINNLRIGSMINTVEKGPIDAMWRLGGQDTTSRGDQVVWGHYYANPSDVTWGSQDNPDLFVKIWFDVSGRVDVNFFHVSVPDIEVYSDLPSDATYDQRGTTIMDDRYIRHEYWRADQTCTDNDSDSYYAESGCGTIVDCNDNDNTTYPGASETCNDGKDNDCDDNTDCADSDCSADSSCQSFDSLGMSFVLVPAGTFTMGSPEDEPGRASDETQHQVTISNSFYMQTTEVTQAQWEAVMGSDRSHFSGFADCPVERVSWNDVQDFITALNAMGEGTYRLPTEAEWEYACRAGSTTAFPNGDITETGCRYDPNLMGMGWYCYNASHKTHPVARKDPNAWGLYDMHGNVGEWCQDWYGDYPSGHVTDPTGPSSGEKRVLRGGYYDDLVVDLRSACRSWAYPAIPYWSMYGFRVARTF